MWWKIYFWFFTVFTIIGLFSLLQYSPLAIGDIVVVILNIVLIVGLYAFVFKKYIFSPRIWKIIFWIIIIFLVETFLELYVLPKDFVNNYLSFLKSNMPFSESDALLGWLISLPILYAIYKLSTKDK